MRTVTDTVAHPLRRYESTVEQVLEYIVRGELQPGQALPPEREFATALGVSRNVLRQAFSVLEERGLISTRRGSGRYVRELPTPAHHTMIDVTDLEAASIADILEARTLLEVEVVALACQRRTLAEANELCELATRHDSWSDNLRFHTAIAAATHNFMLERLVREQTVLSGELRQRDHYAAPYERGSALSSDHERIAAAIRNRDGTLARRLVREHLEHTRRAVLGGNGEADAPPADKLVAQNDRLREVPS